MFLVATLVGMNATAQITFPVREMQLRRLVVPDGPDAKALEVHIAPGYLTTLAFDAALAPDAVRLEGKRERFARVEISERTIVLEPSTPLHPGERLLLTVGYADPQVASHPLLALVGHPSLVDSQVRVARPARTAAELLQELNEERARLAVAHADAEVLRARCGLSSLGGALVAGVMGAGTVELRLLASTSMDQRGVQADGLVQFYKSSEKLAFLVSLRNPEASQPWKPSQGVIHDLLTRQTLPTQVYMDRPVLAPGGTMKVAVEAPSLPTTASTYRFRVEVWNAEGTRGVIWPELSP
jgi:uncharacterized protein (TIGR02268 family)